MATQQKTRNIALTPHFDAFVREKIQSGRYQSASEVVRESLRLMERFEAERKRALGELDRSIRTGYQQIKTGQTVDADEVFAEIKAMSAAVRKPTKKSK